MSRRPKPLGTIGPHLARSRTVICIGAGGVGKTTVSAAMSVRAARAGRRVACLTIDPARRLADSLGLGPEDRGGGLRDITGILGEDVHPGGRLAFGMLDSKRTFDALVRERASSPEAAERILENRLYRYVSGSLSGMQEYMALEELFEIRGDPEVEITVLDTPPAASALDFFTAPRRMREALDGPLVRAMRRAYGGPGRAGLDLVGRWAGAVLRAIGRFTGAELLDEMMSFVEALSDLFGSFAERAGSVERALRSDEVVFCLVTAPDRATVRDSRVIKRRLARLGFPVHAVIFNRAHWPRAAAPPEGLAPPVRGEIEALGEEWNAAHEREAAVVVDVRRHWDDLDAVSVVPLMPEGATRVESLDRIARYL